MKKIKNTTKRTKKRLQDLTEFEQAEKALRKSEKRYRTLVKKDIAEHKRIDRAKTEFVSLAAHQLRTPLTGIKWSIEMLLSEKAEKFSKRQKEYLEDIRRNNQRLIVLVNALLNVSRIELGTFVVEPRPISFIKIADGVLEELGPEIKNKKLEIRRNYDKKLPIINADPNLSRIIFHNILTNAVKYTPKRGRISLTIKKQELNILIEISDTGCGIPKHQQSEIFKKLFRADNAQGVEPDGTGLGLYIVKAVIEQPGGKIWFKSEENKGTVFYITIPLKGMKKKKGARGLTPV